MHCQWPATQSTDRPTHRIYRLRSRMGNRNGRSFGQSRSSKTLSNCPDPMRPSITVTMALDGVERLSPTVDCLHPPARPMRSTSSAPGDFAPLVSLLLRPTNMSRSRSLSPIAPPMQRYSRHAAVKATSSKLLAFGQRRIICDSWRRAFGHCRSQGICFGMLVFRHVCDESAQFKLLFDLPVDQNLDLIHSHHSFVRHARIFANMIDLTVRNIDELEVQVTPALFVYGRRHYYKMREGFNNKMLHVFAQSIVRTICLVLDDKRTPETVGAWEQLIQYMLSKLKEGYDFESIHSKKSRLSHRFGDLFAIT